MLAHWLQPINFDDILLYEDLEDFHFGKNIAIYDSEMPNFEGVNIAIIGIGQKEANTVRKHLYQLSYKFPKINIADLGNVRKESVEFIIPIIKELLSANILPLILGNEMYFTLAQYQAYQSFEHLINVVMVDKSVNFSLEKRPKKNLHLYLNQMLKRRNNHLFNFSLLGYQSHYINPAILKTFSNRNYDYLRLGHIRATLAEAEPLIRDADMMSINVASIRQSESPGSLHNTPSGFFAEEICKMAHYAGMNDKLTSFGIYGYFPDRDHYNQSAKLISQMLWYFLEGYASRKQDYPINTDGLVEYVVDFKSGNYQITFWKSTRSDRWWMQVPIKSKKLERHKLIPCSYQDYKLAVKGELPERLVNAFNRF